MGVKRWSEHIMWYLVVRLGSNAKEQAKLTVKGKGKDIPVTGH
jgi:hypothetical protein